MIVAIVYAHCYHCPKTHQSGWTHRTDRFLVESSPPWLLHDSTLWTPLPVIFGGTINTLYLTLRIQPVDPPMATTVEHRVSRSQAGVRLQPPDRLTYWSFLDSRDWSTSETRLWIYSNKRWPAAPFMNASYYLIQATSRSNPGLHRC